MMIKLVAHLQKKNNFKPMIRQSLRLQDIGSVMTNYDWNEYQYLSQKKKEWSKMIYDIELAKVKCLLVW